MKTVVFSNQKGGVGKTTLCLQLGHYIAEKNLRALLVDADPQGNLSKSLVDVPGFGLYEALNASEYEVEAVRENLNLLAGNVKLALLEKSLLGEVDAYTRFKELLKGEVFQSFDYILIDSPPSLGILAINALTAADYLVIPMNPSVYSMQGTNDLMETVAKVRRTLNPNLSLLGVIINAFDPVPSITRQIKDEIHQAFGERVFSNVLSRSVRIEEAIASRTAVTTRKSKVAGEVKQLGEEFLLKLGAL